MARTSNRRWKGCRLCKPYKNAGNGDAERMPGAALRQYGALNAGRVNRHDAGDGDSARTPPRRSRRKDTRRWCKGKPGREHVPALVVRGWNSALACGPRPQWDPVRHQMAQGWACYHMQACTVCGKILQHRIPASECPDRAAAATHA